MSVFLESGLVLINGGLVATSSGCCCGGTCCQIDISGAGASGQVNICGGSAQYQFPTDVMFSCSSSTGCADISSCGPSTESFTESGGHCPDGSNESTTFTVNSVSLTFSGGNWTLHASFTATVMCTCGNISTTATTSQIIPAGHLNGVHSYSGNFASDSQPNLNWGATFTITASCMGACCFGDGSCSIETSDTCHSMGGTYQGDHTTCTPNPC